MNFKSYTSHISANLKQTTDFAYLREILDDLFDYVVRILKIILNISVMFLHFHEGSFFLKHQVSFKLSFAAFCHSKTCSGDLLKDKVCKDSIQPTCGNRVARSIDDDDCEQTKACICPSATPLRFNDRCYKTFECPKVNVVWISCRIINHLLEKSLYIFHAFV